MFKYKIWWKDKEASRIRGILFNKLLPLNLLLFSFTLLCKFEITEYLFIVLMSTVLEIFVIDYFKKIPNGFIENNMSEEVKTKIRFIFLIAGIVGWYSATMPIWIKYYPNLKKLPFAEHFMHPYGSLWKYISPPIKEKSNDNNNL